MQNYTLCCLFLLFALNLQAQHITPCGTPPIKSEWLTNYQANPEAYTKAEDSLLYVPVTVHVLGTDEGQGYYSIDQIARTFCQLNVDFEPVNIRFYIEGDLNYINNTTWYEHEDYGDGIIMMDENNIPGTFNCYIVETAIGAGGYYSPAADAVALTKGNLNSSTSHTWAHEAGHYFTLSHTFLGWESIDYSFNEPTPEYVDGWGVRPVERMDGSNCTEAADGFCDTPPDYLSYIFSCDNMGFSTQQLKDPDSIFFRADGGNFMSYATSACNSYFSQEQQNAMRANLMDARPFLLTNQDVLDVPVTETVQLLEPAQNEVITEALTLQWSSVEDASHYYYEINRLPTFSPSFVIDAGMLTDTFALAENLTNDLTYYWRVRPLNMTYPCEGEYITGTFMTGEVLPVGIEDVMAVKDLRLYPNILSVGQTARLEMESNEPVDIQIHLLDVSGRQVNTVFSGQTMGVFSQDIQTGSLSPGLYWVAIAANGVWTQRKLVILNE